MTAKEKWNRLVDSYNLLAGQLENVVQFIWENEICQNYFGFSRANVDPQRVVQMGVAQKRADIVLSKDENEECVIELKRADLAIGREQLFSYLKQIQTISIGVLAGDKLHVYYYDYTSLEPIDSRPNVEIPFETDNSDGIKFMELFEFNTFDRESIKNWIIERYDAIRAARMENERAHQNVLEMAEWLTEENVRDVVKNHFIAEGYPENDVDMFLQSRFISVGVLDGGIPGEPDGEDVDRGGRAQYVFDGETLTMGKIALRVVKKYVGDHVGCTYNQIQNAFNMTLSFGRKPMIRRKRDMTPTEIRYKRAYIGVNDLISVADAEDVCVNSQWVKEDFVQFISKARDLGYEITRT